MKNKFGFTSFLMFLLLLITGNVKSQDATVRAYPMEEKSLLWEISGPNVQSKSYLFGTIHVIDEAKFFFPKKLEKIVSKSELLTLEIANITDLAGSMNAMMLDEGTFFDYFNQEQIDSIFAWAEANMGLKEASFRTMFSKMRPIVISELINQSKRTSDIKSYELELEAMAKESGIEIKGLETIEDQLSAMDGLTDEMQAQMVMDAIAHDGSSDSLELKMIDLYIHQDVDGLYEMISAEALSEEGGADMQRTLLDDRNEKWIPQIKKMISEKKTFIAVGAGHLGGPNGVIRLLENEGYTLTPVEL